MKYTMSTKEPARKLGVSTRRVKSLKKAVWERGDEAVIHGNAGRRPVNAADEGIRKKDYRLEKSDKYQKANFTHFRELLEEYEQIKISYTGLSRILKGADVTSPRRAVAPTQGGRCGNAGGEVRGTGSNRCCAI
jgi:transposase